VRLVANAASALHWHQLFWHLVQLGGFATTGAGVGLASAIAFALAACISNFSLFLSIFFEQCFGLAAFSRLCKCISRSFCICYCFSLAFQLILSLNSASDLTVGFTTALKVQLSVFSSWDYGAFFFVIIAIITFEFVAKTNSCEGPNCELPNAFHNYSNAILGVTFIPIP
jgi:hypothetical protein